MIKAIPFKDVRAGDVVCEKEDKPLVIERVNNEEWGKVTLVALWIKDGPILRGEKKTIIGLLHRPWPEGKTAEDMVRAIAHCTYRVDRVWEITTSRGGSAHDIGNNYEMGKALASVSEALDAYELGKPGPPKKHEVWGPSHDDGDYLT